MKQNRTRSGTEDPSSVGSQLMGLSLFVMLLAFFIVLNAISSYNEEKVRPTLSSLEQVFISPMQGREASTGYQGQGEKAGDEGDVLDRMTGLFNAQIAGVEANVEKQWGTMHIRASLREFAAAVLALKAGEIKDPKAAYGGKAFLPTLVSLMETGDQTRKFRMDMIVSTPKDPADMRNDDPKALGAYALQLSKLAVALEKAGLGESFVSIGLQKGPADTIDLYFRPFEAFSPVDEDEAGDGGGTPAAGEAP